MENDDLYTPDENEKENFHIEAPEEDKSPEEGINLTNFLGALEDYEAKKEAKETSTAEQNTQESGGSLPKIPVLGQEKPSPFNVQKPAEGKPEPKLEKPSAAEDDDSFEEMIKELDEDKIQENPPSKQDNLSYEEPVLTQNNDDDNYINNKDDKNSDTYKAEIQRNKSSLVTQLINKSIKRNRVAPPSGQLRNQFKDKFEEFKSPEIEQPRPVFEENTKADMFQTLTDEQAMEEASQKTDALFNEGLGDLSSPKKDKNSEEKKSDDMVAKFMQKIKSDDYQKQKNAPNEIKDNTKEPEQIINETTVEQAEEVLPEPAQVVEEEAVVPTEEILPEPEQIIDNLLEETAENIPIIDTVDEDSTNNPNPEPLPMEEFSPEPELQVDTPEQESLDIVQAFVQPKEESITVEESSDDTDTVDRNSQEALQFQVRNLALKEDESVRVMFTTTDNIITGELQIPEIIDSDGLTEEELMYQILNCDYKFVAIKDCYIMDKDNTEFEPEKVKFYVLNTDTVLSCKVVSGMDIKNIKEMS